MRVLSLIVGLTCLHGLPAFSQIAPPPEFFPTFAAATAHYEQGKAREGATALQAMSEKTRVTPWREIAMLKAAELQESFDRAAATKNYQEIVTQWKDRATEKVTQSLVAIAGRGLQRLEAAEIEAALRKYYLDHVEYPASLDALVQGKYIADDKVRDVSGKPYGYTTGVEKLVPGVPRQTFTLDKVEPPPFGWRDAKVVGLSAETAVLQWPNAPSCTVKAGETVEGLEVISLAAKGIVLANPTRLVVLSYP